MILTSVCVEEIKERFGVTIHAHLCHMHMLAIKKNLSRFCVFFVWTGPRRMPFQH